MKKLFVSVLACSMLLVGCGGGSGDKEKTAEKKPEIIMITDKGTIDDKSFNQGTYEGVKAFAEKQKVGYKYIKPQEATTVAYCDSIDQAVREGAKTIVCPGFLFEEAIYKKQTEYQDVKFILIDGNPHNADYSDYKTEKNTVGITFKEQESGYLAGYAAVKEGFTKLGYLGGQAVPAVVKFGYGYLQGANDAAKELGIKVDVKYHNTNGFSATPEAQSLAASWYKDGTQVIFGCGGSVGNSAMAASKDANPQGKVIGVDVDQSKESETVITSAMKQLAVAVQDQLSSIYNNKFEGGKNLVKGASENSVALPMETSKFEKFTQADYDKVFKAIAEGNVKIPDEKAAKTADQLKLDNVKVTVFK